MSAFAVGFSSLLCMANRLTAHCSHGRGSAISTTSVVPSFGVPCHMPVSSAGRRSSCRTQTMTPFPSFECFRQPVFEPFRIVRHRLESPSAMQRLSPIPAVPVILDHASMMHAMHTPPSRCFHTAKKRGVCGIACICRHVVLLASLSYFVLSSYASIAGMMFAMGFISHVVFRSVVAPRCLIFAGFGLECCRCSVKHAVMVGWRLTPIWLVRWHDCNQLRNHARDVAVSCRYVRLFWLHRWNRRQRLWFVRHIVFCVMSGVFPCGHCSYEWEIAGTTPLLSLALSLSRLPLLPLK